MTKLQELIDLFGGQSALARSLGVSDAAVSQWMADGALPSRRAIEVERLTQGAFRAVDISRSDIDASVPRS